MKYVAGVISLDAGEAKRQGWTEDQIERAWGILMAVANAETKRAYMRKPDLYRISGGGTLVFTAGDPELEAVFEPVEAEEVDEERF